MPAKFSPARKLPDSEIERRKRRADHLYTYLKEYLLVHPKAIVRMILPGYRKVLMAQGGRRVTDVWERVREPLKDLEVSGRIKVQAKRRADGAVHDWWNAEITLE